MSFHSDEGGLVRNSVYSLIELETSPSIITGVLVSLPLLCVS
jgi:hypothetical protein